jgi:hypothetical protein
MMEREYRRKEGKDKCMRVYKMQEETSCSNSYGYYANNLVILQL